MSQNILNYRGLFCRLRPEPAEQASVTYSLLSVIITVYGYQFLTGRNME